jgi:heptose-I-phosphate ethanolaminephosphotransferase
VGLFFTTRYDFKYFAPICYYELIVSFLLLFPVLLLPRLLSRLWVVAVGALTALATLVVGFYAACFGARWNLSAHAALMQTNPLQSRDFAVNFLTPGLISYVVILGLALVIPVIVNVRSVAPPWRVRLAFFLVGAAGSFYGIRNAIHYGGALTRRYVVSPTQTVRFVDSGYGKLHPVTFLAMIHFNYVATNRFFMRQYRDVAPHLKELSGAHPLKGAVPPRLMVVVVGESASRRHWSLYGYSKKTTPRLDALAPELVVFRDVVATCVSTVFSLHDMFAIRENSVPSFPLFSQAGYGMHWFSAQFDQGAGDLQINALVAQCRDKVFLNGVYDENLEPLVARAADQPGRQLIFAHLFGSHVRYRDRYPENFERFHANDDSGPLHSSYDNSILYTDTVLGDLIDILKSRHESACLLYVSDHGEDVLDSRPDKYLFRDDTLATDPMYEVPFVVWFSPEYIRDNRDFVAGVAASRNRKFQDRFLYMELLDLARLGHPFYDPRLSLFSPQFVERVRRVGVMGRVYRGGPSGR